MLEGMARAHFVLSCLRRPVLHSVAAERGDSAAVVALAKRIKLTGWFDPPSAGAAAHSLSYRRLAPWDQATIKLTIAKFLHDAQLGNTGIMRIAIFGTCGREKDPKATYTDDVITGFEFRGQQFAFTTPLRFVQGCGIEVNLG